MAQASYEKMLRVFGKQPSERREFEIKDILPWFRKNYNIFRNLDPATVFDILANAKFESKKPDEIIIRQGDIGDCMYVLLKGRVTVYIQYTKADVDDRPTIQNNQQQTSAQSIRHSLGTFVTNIVPGMTFGEVALMSEDSIRSASILADEASELVVIHRHLYKRSVESFLKADFEARLSFIDENIYFQKMAPRFRKQLAMALQTSTLHYDEQLTMQGEPVAALYFIQSGEVELYVDATQYEFQYSKWNPGLNQSSHWQPDLKSTDWLKESQKERNSRRNSLATGIVRSRSSLAWQLKPLCILAKNECIGDIEVLMGLDTYTQTSICKHKGTILVLELKHFERLISKRNPRIQEMMHSGLESRLKARLGLLAATQKIPFYDFLLSAVRFVEEKLKKQEQFRMNAIQEVGSTDGSNREVSSPDSRSNDITSRRPTRILYQAINSSDYSGFRSRRSPSHRVSIFNSTPASRNSYRSRATPLPTITDRSENTENFSSGLIERQENGRLEDNDQLPKVENGSNSKGTEWNGKILSKSQYRRSIRAEPTLGVENYTSNVALSKLENRMREWLHDINNHCPSRVEPFQRTESITDDAKPGMIVVLRTKPKPPSQQLAKSYSTLTSEEFKNFDDYIPQSSRQMKQRLDFYRFALNAKIPDIEKRSSEEYNVLSEKERPSR